MKLGLPIVKVDVASWKGQNETTVTKPVETLMSVEIGSRHIAGEFERDLLTKSANELESKNLWTGFLLAGYHRRHGFWQ